MRKQDTLFPVYMSTQRRRQTCKIVDCQGAVGVERVVQGAEQRSQSVVFGKQSGPQITAQQIKKKLFFFCKVAGKP